MVSKEKKTIGGSDQSGLFAAVSGVTAATSGDFNLKSAGLSINQAIDGRSGTAGLGVERCVPPTAPITAANLSASETSASTNVVLELPTNNITGKLAANLASEIGRASCRGRVATSVVGAWCQRRRRRLAAATSRACSRRSAA